MARLSQRWTVQERYGHTVYLTQERWEHIIVNGLRLGAPDAQAVDFLIRPGHI